MSRFVSRCSTALFVLALAVSSSVGAQSPSAQQFIEQRQHAASTLLRRPANDARNRELSRVFDEMLDYDELARRSLSRHWNDRTPAERMRFTALLRQLVERAYQDNLQRTLQFEVRFVASESQGDATIVRTEARSRTNRRSPPVAIDYSMHQVGGSWRVFDIHTDGVSLVSNYRSQFNRIITREGFAGLVGRMEARVREGGSDL